MPQSAPPVLEFPQPGLDDFSAYSGYQTRFYRDAVDNTLQISIDKNIGRVINLWADAADESISFSVKDTAGNPVVISWGSADLKNSIDGKTRYAQYSLVSNSPDIDIGLFLLGSMRIERDFRYQDRFKLPINTDTVFVQHELVNLIDNIKKLPADKQKVQLSALNANSIKSLISRLKPSINYFKISAQKGVIIVQPYFNEVHNLSLEISVKDKNTKLELEQNMVHVKNLKGSSITLYIKIGTNSPALTPLTQNQIFNENFLKFYEKAKSGYFSLLARNNNLTPTEKDSLIKFKRLKRQIKSLELLGSKEKLMAGLPNFATYFGRDMMMSALMMEPIWKPSMLENVITSVLKKLRSDGNVSHEEGLVGQAIRENAAKYNSIIQKYFSQKDEKTKDSILSRTTKILKNLQKTTENYRMKDDDFQLPVLTAHYLSYKNISNTKKLNFLKRTIDISNVSTNLSLLLKNLVYVTNEASAYIKNPTVLNLISFEKVNNHWQSASWRDSQAGYANGRFAMDIIVIWVPKALESIQDILNFLKKNDYSIEDLIKLNPDIKGSQLEEFFKNPEKLEKAINLWNGTGKYFWTDLPSKEVKQKIEAKLNWLPKEEGTYWGKVLRNDWKNRSNIKFLTLSLDGNGNRIYVENTDPATSIFLNNFTDDILNNKMPEDSVLDLMKVFTIPYPAGLFVDSLGPLVANDTYASREIWETFKRDRYHSPYVVWGREVNLIFLGLTHQILYAFDDQGNLKSGKLEHYVKELKDILEKVNSAVNESGLKHNELWTYQIKNSRLYPKRYETTSDIQLWNLTNLSAEYLMKKIPNDLK
ncbi:MAG: hypothetical protein P8Z35_07170 [Ignavibacteriaceae bacterium]